MSTVLLLLCEGEGREPALCAKAESTARSSGSLEHQSWRWLDAGCSQMEPVGQVLGKGLPEEAAEALPDQEGQRSNKARSLRSQ